MPETSTLVFVVLQLLGALTLIGVMQVGTKGATFKTYVGRYLWVRRTVFFVIIIVMVWYAAHVIQYNEHFSWVDLIGYCTPQAAIIFLGISWILNEGHHLKQAELTITNPMR